MPPATKICPRWSLGVLGTLACGGVHGTLTGVSIPPLSWWSVAFASVLPLVFAAAQSRLRPIWTGVLCALGMLPFWLITQSWAYAVTDLGFVPMCLLLTSWTGLFVWLLAHAVRAKPASVVAKVGLALLVPLVWTGVEFFRGEICFGGYAWSMLAYPLIDDWRLASPAAYLGVYFVSFLVCIPAGAFAEALVRRPGFRLRSLVSLGLAVLAWIWSAVALPAAPSGPTLRIASVQTNVPQNNKIAWTVEQELSDFERFVQLTRSIQSAAPLPDVVVWPETMMPGTTLVPASLQTLRDEGISLRASIKGQPQSIPITLFADEILGVQKSLGVPMLIGEEALDGLRVARADGGGISLEYAARFNSVFLLREGSVQAPRYDKMRLTPFGEYFPYIRAWPWLQKKIESAGARGMKFDLREGTRRTAFEIPWRASADESSGRSSRAARLVTPICFEDTYSGVCRTLVFEQGERRADVMVNMSNDGWFGNSDLSREMHLQIARWRCVELATPMVRSANTGVSAAIDTRGRITARLQAAHGYQSDGVLLADVTLPDSSPTLFARVGNSFGYVALGVSAVLAAWALLGRCLCRSAHEQSGH